MKNRTSRTNERFLERQFRRKNYKLRRPPGCRLNCNLRNAIKHHYVCYMIRYCRKWGWRDFWRDNFTRPVEDERGQVFGPEAFKWKFDPETFRMVDGRTLKEWESENRYRVTRREQLIQEELKELMLVPSGRTQQEHRQYLESLITWHPEGPDRSRPLAPKPPLTMQTLRMLALIRVMDKLLSGPKTPTAVAAAEKTRAGGKCPDRHSRERERWMRLTKTTIIPLAVAALAGFVGGYRDARARGRFQRVVSKAKQKAARP